MGRKRAFTHNELLDNVELLLHEHGYEGFNMKMLSTHLSGARSTIYQYYANREEIVSACMKRGMTRVLDQTKAIQDQEPLSALKHFLDICTRESKMHEIMGDFTKIENTQSGEVVENIEYIQAAHHQLKNQLAHLLEEAQIADLIRKDIPSPVLMGYFFHLITTPNFLNINSEEWTELLFTLWLEGSATI